MNKPIFTLTSDHIKLLRRFIVGWQDCEFGAPEIDPKRPYGNSDVIEDIREILVKELTDKEARNIHNETQIALQIILFTGKMKPGTYECENYFEWKLIK